MWNHRSRISLEMKGMVKIENLLIPGQLLVQSHVQRISHSQGLHHGWAGGRQGPSPSWEAGLQSRYAKLSRSTDSVVLGVLAVLQECRECQIVLLNNSANFKVKEGTDVNVLQTHFISEKQRCDADCTWGCGSQQGGSQAVAWHRRHHLKNIQPDLWLIWWWWHRRHHRRCLTSSQHLIFYPLFFPA